MLRTILQKDMVRVSQTGVPANAPPVLNEETMVIHSEQSRADRIHAYATIGPFNLANAGFSQTILFPALGVRPFVRVTMRSALDNAVYSNRPDATLHYIYDPGTEQTYYYDVFFSWMSCEVLLDRLVIRARFNEVVNTVGFRNVASWYASTAYTGDNNYYFHALVFRP